MTTDKIIDELDHLVVTSSEDYDQLNRLNELTGLLGRNDDGHLACGAMVRLLQRHPQVTFGTPGQLVHAVESHRGQYEDLLLASLDRQPTATTIWMLNRITNAAADSVRQQLVDRMDSLRTHPLADEQAKAAAEDFYRFQTK